MAFRPWVVQVQVLALAKIVIMKFKQALKDIKRTERRLAVFYGIKEA